MPLPGGELARRLVDRLYADTTTKEAHLCKVALDALVGADIEACAFAEQAKEPIVKRWSKKIMPQADDKRLGGEQLEHLDKV